jgi:signal peptidase I
MTVTPDFGPDTTTVLKCELAAEVLRSSGRLHLQVNGWSMLPSVLPGDTLMLERACGEHISPGEIVLFHRDRRLFAHRVIAKRGQGSELRIVTQGDGMARPDPAVSESELLGKVNFIVRDGRLVEPRKIPGLSQRAVAALVRRSSAAARLVAGIHGMRRSLPEPVQPCHS